ncbi:DNA phosphorothioation-dependent restriction protein DptG [Ruminococcus sp.]
MLNISQEFLLLITASVVKDDKMRINDLFKEYEKRGNQWHIKSYKYDI